MQKLYLNSENLGQRRAWAGWLGMLFLLAATVGVPAADPAGELLEKMAIEAGATNDAETAQTPAHKPDLIAGEDQLSGLGHSITNLEAKNLFGDPVVGSSPNLSRQDLLLILAVIVGGGIALKKLLPGILGSINTWTLSPVPAAAWAGAAEEKTFSDFAVAFRVGPVAAPKPPSLSDSAPTKEAPARWVSELPKPAAQRHLEPEASEPIAVEPKAPTLAEKEENKLSAAAEKETAANPTAGEDTSIPSIPAETDDNVCALPAESPEQFFATVADDFAKMRKFVSQSSGDADLRAILQNLRGLLREIRSLKNKASLPELLPIWQMSAALEGLINQLVEKPTSINSSNLNTVSGAVELLQTLSAPGLKADLVTEPPLRVLAVDDDAICRHAVSFALKKALNAPQLESNPETALALAEKQPYDVILLDVEMPGMDGFELCSRIRKTEINRETPILFVTRHSDYESKAKSTLVGGQDLIAKPFMIFEITVKTLTVLLRGRLKAEASKAAAAAAGGT